MRAWVGWCRASYRSSVITPTHEVTPCCDAVVLHIERAVLLGSLCATVAALNDAATRRSEGSATGVTTARWHEKAAMDGRVHLGARRMPRGSCGSRSADRCGRGGGGGHRQAGRSWRTAAWG